MRNLLIIFFIPMMTAFCGNYNRVSSPEDVPSSLGGPASELTLDFAIIKSQILEPHCISCHTGRHKAYENYDLVKASAFAMLERMESPNPSRRMPLGAPALTEDKLAMFRAWLNAGAPEVVNQDTDTDKPAPVTKNISFIEIKSKILKPYNCVACHSHFNDYGSVKQSLGAIASLVTSDKMPFPKIKGGQVALVSATDKNLLLKWVSQGAPEFSDQPAQDPIQKTLQPTYISIRNHILGPKCTLCHNSYGNRGAGLNLNSFIEIRKAMDRYKALINLDSPNDSHLIGSMLGRVDEDEFFFDAMPFNNGFDDVSLVVDPVTEDELKTIEKWIELKLPYNEDDL
ncbi:MAG: hypothetical protein KDD33_13800 [Bdellovibrionales bacterium]|nr:hypothetical protein [Bdellovibrionales bacterium]